MVYRNGTYIAFHAENNPDPTASDIRYYRLLKAWHENDDIDFRFVNSHDKASAVRDSSKRETIMRSLRARLDQSKNMVLIIGKTTKNDTDFVPYEINYAVNRCGIPIICVYTGYRSILHPKSHRHEWPSALAGHIDAMKVRAFHIPFKRRVIDAAIGQFTISNPPATALGYYSKKGQMSLGVEFDD